MNILLINQRENYLIDLEDAKQRLSHRLRLSIYFNLIGHITPHALKLIHTQYELVTANQTALPPCKHIFTQTTGLPCSHRIQDRMYDEASGGIILLEDVHPHWWFNKPAVRNALQEEDTPPSDNNADMRVRSPQVIRGKGRPQGSLGPLTRREQQFEDSSQRELSGFEHVENATQTTQIQLPHRPRGRPRGSGRKRGRGGARRGNRRGASGQTNQIMEENNGVVEEHAE